MKRSSRRGWSRTGIAVVGVLVAVGCSSPREAALAPPIPAANPDSQLTWGRATQIPGTSVMRVDLVHYRSGLSSSGYPETRNILFLDPAEKAGRWLLPDSRHFLENPRELVATGEDSKANRTLATVALVKEVGQGAEESTGKLVIFDAVGKILEPLAEGVRQVNDASIAPSGEFVVLYERNRQFVIVVVDGSSFKVTREQVFDIPPLD